MGDRRTLTSGHRLVCVTPRNVLLFWSFPPKAKLIARPSGEKLETSS